MKLAAIYNIWDGVELLYGSMQCLRGEVDLFIIVWQDVSNFGEHYNPMNDFKIPDFGCEVMLVKYEPDLKSNGSCNEFLKRRLGIEYAKQEKCTHYLHIDADEYYEDFAAAKKQYIKSRCAGSVCKILTYFKEPTLRLEGADNYFVPFIHTINIKNLGQYPFYVDPTRKDRETDVKLLDVYMHHFSWVRKDIERKTRNSSARKNIEKSKLLQDYHSPELKAGYYLQDYRQKLIEVDNVFGISL